MKTIFLVLTIGYPFCVFKALCGRVALDSGYEITGVALLLWGILDFILNTVELILAVSHSNHERVYCVLAAVGAFFGKKRVFLALDTFLAFSIICFVLWSGWIAKLAPFELHLWLVATTVNLLSVAIVQIWSAWSVEKRIGEVKSNSPESRN